MLSLSNVIDMIIKLFLSKSCLFSDSVSPNIIKNCFPYLQAQRKCKRRWYSVSNLSVLVSDTSFKCKTVLESLAPGALSHRDQPVLIWVQHLPLLAQWFWISDGCFEESLPRYSAECPCPVAVPVRCMWQGPTNKS